MWGVILFICSLPQFKCRNGTEYKLQASDSLSVKIFHDSSKTTLPHALEPARPSGEDSVRISFTPKLAGKYTVEIKINGSFIGSDESLARNYKPG